MTFGVFFYCLAPTENTGQFTRRQFTRRGDIWFLYCLVPTGKVRQFSKRNDIWCILFFLLPCSNRRRRTKLLNRWPWEAFDRGHPTTSVSMPWMSTATVRPSRSRLLHWVNVCLSVHLPICMAVSLNCYMSTLHLVHYALLLTPAYWKSNNAGLTAFAPSLSLDPTFGIHSHKTLDTVQPCHLLKPNWKPSSSHSISTPTNISTQFLLQS